MFKKITAFFPMVLGMVVLATAQETKIYTHEQKAFQDALALYNNEQYQAAQTIFNKVKVSAKNEETAANSAYYAANAAVRLNQIGADRLMEDFVEKYPTSTKRNSAFADVAEYYFQTGKYPYALKWYNKVDQSSLSRGEMDKFNFNYGYSLFSSRKTKEAEKYLEKVTTSPVYGSQAKYYLGYISYQQDDYETANERFDQITDQDVLEEKLSYYQADMNFKLGKFEEAIALAKKQLPKSDRKEVSELNKIIGESYFNLDQYENAIPYLKEYNGKGGKWSNTDYYYLGYAYYKGGDYANAIAQFNKIIGGTNSVAQNAYYHLAECYLKMDKKQEALNAFRNASQMDYSAEIQKDAFLNYARLSYEVGNAYEAVPAVITNYLKTYPNDEHQQEMQTLLVDSYITSKNFAGAMQLLEENRNYASKTVYQKVAYYRGIELYMEGDYNAASESFGKSLSSAEDMLFKARANYWKAEADYNSNRFDDAASGFMSFKNNPSAQNTEMYEDIDYNLAYAFFKQKDYSNAITYFGSFVKNRGVEVEKLHDGFLRLGDSYYATSKYRPSNKIFILIPYKTLAQFESTEKLLALDKAHLTQGADYINASFDNPPYERINSVLMRAFEDMPKMKPTTVEGPRKERVYELRSYESPTEALYKNKVHMFNQGGEVTLFDELGFNAVFYAEVISGDRMPNLMYMTTFTDMNKRDALWKNFGDSPKWKEISSMKKYQNNMNKLDKDLLYPTSYSDY